MDAERLPGGVTAPVAARAFEAATSSTPPAGADVARPRFTVVVPALNEAAVLAACLSSLAAQEVEGLVEVIVVDNASTDRTAEIARNLGATVVVEPRRGVCAARQRGTEAAHGEIIVSTDADTVFAPHWLTGIDAHFTTDDTTVMVAGPARFVDAPVWARVYPKLLFGASAFAARRRGRPFYVTACNLAFRKSAWDGYNTNLTQAGDELDLLRRIKPKGRVVFDNSNPTFTSARRLKRGLLYNFFVTFLTYYFIEFVVGRFTGRSLFGSYPALRTTSEINRGRSLRRAVAVAAVAAIGLLTPVSAVLADWGGEVSHTVLRAI